LDLSDTYIDHGPLPGESFEGLNELQTLDLSGNIFSSTIPEQMWERNLGSLRVLFLDRVGLPSSQDLMFLTTLTSLVQLWLDFSSSFLLEKTIPSELGQLQYLVGISMGSAGLEGIIPTELGNLPLTRLWLHENNLSGTVPTQLGQLESLRFLSLQGNPRLEGSIPLEICQRRVPQGSLEWLGSDCQVDGNLVCACCTCCGVRCGKLDG